MGEVLNLRQHEEPMETRESHDHGDDLSWETKDVDAIHRTPWILIGGLLGAALLVVAFTSNPLFAVILAATAGVLILESKKEKKASRSIALTETGIQIDEDHHFYHDFHSFWIDYQPGGKKELTVRTRKLATPILRLPLEGKDPLEVRAHMVLYVPEREPESSLIDSVLRRFGL